MKISFGERRLLFRSTDDIPFPNSHQFEEISEPIAQGAEAPLSLEGILETLEVELQPLCLKMKEIRGNIQRIEKLVLGYRLQNDPMYEPVIRTHEQCLKDCSFSDLHSASERKKS